MRDAPTSWPVGGAQPHRSSRAGFALILSLGLALLSTGCAQPDQGYPLTASQDHVRLPSLAPVVQAVMPAVVHVSAVQRPDRTGVGEEGSAGVRRWKHQSADRGLPPAALAELLRRFFGMPEMPIRSSDSGFIIDPEGYIVTPNRLPRSGRATAGADDVIVLGRAGPTGKARRAPDCGALTAGAHGTNEGRSQVRNRLAAGEGTGGTRENKSWRRVDTRLHLCLS